jgi:hypothetical protein
MDGYDRLAKAVVTLEGYVTVVGFIVVLSVTVFGFWLAYV